MTYGSQTWSLTKRLTNKNCSKSNGDENVKYKTTRQSTILRDKKKKGPKINDIIESILKQKRKWAGYIARMKNNRRTKPCTEWQPKRVKRSRGRLSRRWKDDIVKDWGKHLKQDSIRQATMVGIDGGLHPAVDGQRPSEVNWYGWDVRFEHNVKGAKTTHTSLLWQNAVIQPPCWNMETKTVWTEKWLMVNLLPKAQPDTTIEARRKTRQKEIAARYDNRGAKEDKTEGNHSSIQ